MTAAGGLAIVTGGLEIEVKGHSENSAQMRHRIKQGFILAVALCHGWLTQGSYSWDIGVLAVVVDLTTLSVADKVPGHGKAAFFCAE